MVTNSSRRANQPPWWMHPAWWTGALIVAVIVIVVMTAVLFSGAYRSYVDVTLKSERIRLIMEPGGKVRMRGMEVGRVARVGMGRRHSERRVPILERRRSERDNEVFLA